jgi:hypothetical protein
MHKTASQIICKFCWICHAKLILDRIADILCERFSDDFHEMCEIGVKMVHKMCKFAAKMVHKM